MMKNRMKQGGAVLLAAALMFSAFVLPKTYAALAVDTDAKCSVEVNVSTAEYSELKTLPVKVNLYKVADIDVTGEYTAEGAFASLSFADVSSKTTAEEWEAKAAAAKALVTDEVAANAVITLEDGVGTAENLETGLYLVDAQTALSDANQYDFNPYLISLPNNYFYKTQNDDWVYDLTGTNAVGLKPEKSDRYGDLVINKSLPVYNATIGGATFVFQVEAVKTDVDTKEETVVYSDVVSMTFDAPGAKSIKINDIPAGAEVTVTEIYSGASYKLESESSVNVTIIADATEEEEVEVASADFKNTYDGKLNGGNGVVNTFKYNNGSFEWNEGAVESPAEIQNKVPEVVQDNTDVVPQ